MNGDSSGLARSADFFLLSIFTSILLPTAKLSGRDDDVCRACGDNEKSASAVATTSATSRRDVIMSKQS